MRLEARTAWLHVGPLEGSVEGFCDDWINVVAAPFIPSPRYSGERVRVRGGVRRSKIAPHPSCGNQRRTWGEGMFFWNAEPHRVARQ
jgi:hypothetical protein